MRVGQVIFLKNEGGSGNFFLNEGGWKHILYFILGGGSDTQKI